MTENQKVPVEEEESNVIVTDPEDYRKTQKLKSIQEAKDHYKSFTVDESKKYEDLKKTWTNPKQAMKNKRAEALALYGSELLPLIEEAIDKGALAEDDLMVETDEFIANLLGKSEMDIREIVDTRGSIWANGEKQAIPKQYQMRVYRQLERIERKLGFGLEMEEDKGPAEI